MEQIKNIPLESIELSPLNPRKTFDKEALQELADKLGTITYEILTSVSRRVQRLYFYE